jgi:hypothetical protein
MIRLPETNERKIKNFRNILRYKRKSIQALVLVFLALASLLMFIGLWEENSNKQQIHTDVEIEHIDQGKQNETRIYHIQTIVIFENYFPFYSNNYQPVLTKYFTSYYSNPSSHLVTTPPPEEISFSLRNWNEATNITVESIERTYTYGEEEVKPPVKETGGSFNYLAPVAMAKNTYTIKWNYVISAHSIDDNQSSLSGYQLRYDPIYNTGLNIKSTFNYLLNPISTGLPLGIGMLIPPLIFDLLIVLLGFTFSWFIFRKKSDLKNAYKVISKEANLQENKADTKELSGHLRVLRYAPTLLGSLTRIIFGLSILLFKNSINGKVKRLLNKSSLQGEEDAKAPFAKYLEDSDTGLSELIPEQKTILLVIGFLASVGISFSWNIGAATPFLYSVGLFYLFINLGGALYLLKGSSKEIVLIVVVILVLILATLIPQILEVLRNRVYHLQRILP